MPPASAGAGPLPHLRRLLPYLGRHRGALLRGLVCLLLTTGLAVASPWVLRHAVDDLQQAVTREKLWWYAGLLVGLVILEGGFRYLMRMILIGTSRELEYELRNDVFAHLTRLPPAYYQANRIGDVMSRATNDMAGVRMVLGPGIMYTANTAATFFGTLALMLAISPPLTGLSLIPLLFVSFLVRHFGRQIHDRSERVQEQLATMNALVQENLSGVRVVRAYAQEEHELLRFERANRELVERNRGLIRMSGGLYPAIQALMGVGAALVLLLGGRAVVAGSISLGEFVAFSAYLTMLHWPMIALGWVVNLFERGEASMGRINAVLDERGGAAPAPPEPARALGPGEPGSAPGATPPVALRGAVEFRGLSFGYSPGRPVLRDVTLKVPAGSTVAIVGPTGSGKSTLVSLLARIFEPPPGSLFVDGHDVRELPLPALRGAIGFVPQESFLFSRTVRENVALGLHQAPAAESRVMDAARIAQLEKDVADFPLGFETMVGERGITLSGGQKQRTALARALAVDPRILVLDDALASVDTHTEEQILSGLRGVFGTRTTFLVSHRVSTVQGADLIVVLREGRVVESGSHAELVQGGGFYADLHQRQLLEEEMASTA